MTCRTASSGGDANGLVHPQSMVLRSYRGTVSRPDTVTMRDIAVACHPERHAVESRDNTITAGSRERLIERGDRVSAVSIVPVDEHPPIRSRKPQRIALALVAGHLRQHRQKRIRQFNGLLQGERSRRASVRTCSSSAGPRDGKTIGAAPTPATNHGVVGSRPDSGASITSRGAMDSAVRMRDTATSVPVSGSIPTTGVCPSTGAATP